MGTWGIDDYQPHWTDSAKRLAEILLESKLIDLQVESCWSLRDVYDDWFSDAPVVICTLGGQLEFCATQFDKFSFSLNSIDLQQPVFWCGDADGDSEPLTWVQGMNAEFDGLVGQQIVGVEVAESFVDTGLQVFSGVTPRSLTGVVLLFEAGRLEILNGLDQNYLSRDRSHRLQQDLHYRRVI